MRMHQHYIPVTDITPGMVLGETVQVVERGVLSMVLDESVRPLFGRMEARSRHANLFFSPSEHPGKP